MASEPAVSDVQAQGISRQETRNIERLAMDVSNNRISCSVGGDEMKIGDLRRSLFTHYNSAWNALVRDVTAKLEQPEEEVSEIETYKMLIQDLRDLVHCDRMTGKNCEKHIAELFKERV